MADADPVTVLQAEQPGAAGRAATRRRAFAIVALVLGLAALGYGLWDYFVGARRVTTDNAYVGADSAQVTPLVAAAVISVQVRETQIVRAGDVLVVLDQEDLKLALTQAEAQLGTAIRRVAGYYANSRALEAQIIARNADISAAHARLASADADLARARVDLNRRQALAKSGAVSGDELTNAVNSNAAAVASVAVARAAVAQAQAQSGFAAGSKAINTALISGTTPEQNPEVRAARAAVEKARLDLARTMIRAPIGGVVTRKTVQVGQRVAPGASLMTIVPVETAFVDANFKEGQLQKVQVGQPVALTSDIYGSNVVYHGRVTGLSGGTGAAFALIPAQNATGNWIKVVQRLPVRITLDPRELRAHPLRIGLSMDVDIDTSGNNEAPKAAPIG